MQKLLFLILCTVLTFFQTELWFGKGGIYDNQHLQQVIGQQINNNQRLYQRNDELISHLQELKGSTEVMEARARYELNLIKPNETLVLFNQIESATY
jgi:cell division protein FtsB